MPGVGGGGTRPGTGVGTKPGTGVGTRPGTGTGARPGTLPSTKPGTGVGNRPGTKPGTGVGNRPGTGVGNRPGTKPGTGVGNRPGNKPGVGNRPGTGTKPGWNNRPAQLPSFGNRPGNRPGTGVGNRPGGGNNNWWNSNRNNVNIGNKVNVNINNNFKNSRNWSTNRKHWGGNPWWNRPANRPWYGGSWHCGWNKRWYGYHGHRHYHYFPGYYHGPSAGAVIGWGLAAWGLGALIYNCGYNAYRNPYPVQPVPTATSVTYSQPITVVAAEQSPTDQAVVEKATEQSESYVLKSQDAFKQGNYLAAMEAVNQAIAAEPTDGALHEYRALILFALGKYGEATGVLNPTLAGGPGWDWTTMVTLYDSQATYTAQLRKLEEFSKAKPSDAAAHFLLGYHYMVCGYVDLAQSQFATTTKLQPADTVSRQLADLLAATEPASDKPGEAAADQAAPAAPPAEDSTEPAAPAPEPIPLDKLAATWVAKQGESGKITLTLKDDGKFTWAYVNGSEKFDMGGDFSMNSDGLLVLDAEESQMLASVTMPEDGELKFVLADGPPDDPGLDFTKG